MQYVIICGFASIIRHYHARLARNIRYDDVKLNICCKRKIVPIKAALADRKRVVKTGSIFMGRGRVMGRGSAESRLMGMGRGSVGAWLSDMGRGSAGKEIRV